MDSVFSLYLFIHRSFFDGAPTQMRCLQGGVDALLPGSPDAEGGGGMRRTLTDEMAAYEKPLERLDEALLAIIAKTTTAKRTMLRKVLRVTFSKKRRDLLKRSKLAKEALALDRNEKLRFLISRKGDVGKALEFILLRVKWWHDANVTSLFRSNSGNEFRAQERWGTCYWLNRDLEGLPIFVIRVCRHNPKLFSAETTYRYLLWKTLGFLHSRPKTDKITVIVDFMFANRANLDMKLIKMVIPTLQNYFPERLSHCIVYPSTLFVWMLWKTASVFLDDRTEKKIIFLREKKKKKLLKYIALDRLQRRFGGTCDVDFGNPPHDIGGGSRTGDDSNHSYAASEEEYSSFLAKHEALMEMARSHISFKSRSNIVPSDTTFSAALEEDKRAPDADSRQSSAGESSECEQDAGGIVDITAGQSLSKIAFTEALAAASGPSWSVCDPKTWKVRCGPNYKKNKFKAFSSAPAVYDTVAVDVYTCENRVEHFAKYVRIGKALDVRGESPLSPLLIITLSTPHYEPALFRGKKDGPGSIVIVYCRVSDWALQHLDHPSVRLMSRFQNCHDGDPFRNRFKIIARTMNIPEIGLGRVERAIASKYNGTPFLSRPQHSFYKGKGYFEIDIDAHRFNYLCRRTGYQQLKKFPRYLIELGFVVQAEVDEEMPERMLCCCRLYKIDFEGAPTLDPIMQQPGSPKVVSPVKGLMRRWKVESDEKSLKRRGSATSFFSANGDSPSEDDGTDYEDCLAG